VEKAAKEAEAHAEEDKKKRESAEARNQLENSIYQAEKMKTDYKDKLSEEDIKTLDEATTEAKGKVESTDKDELEGAVKALSEKIMPIGAKMYEQAQKEAPAEDDSKTEESKNSDKEDVVEGEVVKDDEDNKDDKDKGKK
jgi:molecular chaperone DnaK